MIIKIKMTVTEGGFNESFRGAEGYTEDEITEFLELAEKKCHEALVEYSFAEIDTHFFVISENGTEKPVIDIEDCPNKLYDTLISIIKEEVNEAIEKAWEDFLRQMNEKE